MVFEMGAHVFVPTSYSAPVASSAPPSPMPPQMNTLFSEGMNAYAAWLRAAMLPALPVGTHFGVQSPLTQVRPTPQSLPQPPQFLASVVGSTHCVLHRIWGLVQVAVTH